MAVVITCSCSPDNDGPTISAEDEFLLVSIVPRNGVNDVPVTSLISATFSYEIDSGTLTSTSFTVTGVIGSISYFGRTATFRPDGNLKYGTEYSARLSSGIKSISGRPLNDTIWTFRTDGDSILPEPPPPPEI